MILIDIMGQFDKLIKHMERKLESLHKSNEKPKVMESCLVIQKVKDTQPPRINVRKVLKRE
jgi:hypothetical protein